VNSDVGTRPECHGTGGPASRHAATGRLPLGLDVPPLTDQVVVARDQLSAREAFGLHGIRLEVEHVGLRAVEARGRAWLRLDVVMPAERRVARTHTPDDSRQARQPEQTRIPARTHRTAKTYRT
jgi:hypothetical protein